MGIKDLVDKGRKRGILRYTAMCGHKTADPVRLSFAGWQTAGLVALPRKEGHIHFCGPCLERMSFICAWCCRPIFAGDVVTACKPPRDFEPPLLARQYEADPTKWIGCNRKDCTDSDTKVVGRLVPCDARRLQVVSG